MFDPLVYTQQICDKETPALINFGDWRVYLQHDQIVQVEADDDNLWLLRRMICCQMIDEEYANSLRTMTTPLAVHLFPFIAMRDWQRLLLDRARQNLFDLSLTAVDAEILPYEQPAHSPLRDRSAASILQKFMVHRQSLYALRSALHQLWVKKSDSLSSHPLLDSCPEMFQLSELLVQSPWEELDLLLDLHALQQVGQLRWSDNPAALLNPLTEEEEKLFSDHERQRDNDSFVVEKQKLDKVVIPSKKAPSKVLSMLQEANNILRKMGQIVRGKGKSVAMWLQDLIDTSPPEDQYFFSHTQVLVDGSLTLSGKTSFVGSRRALEYLLLRAARSPQAQDDGRTLMSLIATWEQKWPL